MYFFYIFLLITTSLRLYSVLPDVEVGGNDNELHRDEQDE